MGRSRSEIFELGARADTSGLDKIDKSIRDLAEGFDELADSSEDVGEKSGKAEAGLGKMAAAMAAANLATGALAAGMGLAQGAFSASIGGMFEQEQAMRKVAAQTGLTGDALADFEQQAEDVFLNNWGDGFQDVADTMAIVKQITDENGDALEGVTTNALIMRGAFDSDVTESVRTANTMMEQFGISNERAFDLLAYGIQTTGDPADDLLDTFNEYSGNFADMGLSGDQALRLIQSGLSGGARNADDIADATREFNIKLQEGLAGSETWRESFLALGDDAGGVLTDLEGGYADGADALQFTLDMLRDIEDPIERNRLGVELFGTKWEDVGSKVFDSMTIAGGALDGVEGTLNRAGDELSNGIIPAFDSLKRAASQALVNGLEPLAPAIEDSLIPAMNDFSGWITTTGMPALVDFGSSISPVISDLWTFTSGLFGATVGSDAFIGFMQRVGKILGWVAGELANIDIAGGLAAWADLPNMLGDIGTGLMENIKTSLSGLTVPDLSEFAKTHIINPVKFGINFALTEMTPDSWGIGSFGTSVAEALASNFPDWATWVNTHIITPLVDDGLGGLYGAIATAINNAIPDDIGMDIVIPRPPKPFGVPNRIWNEIPDPLYDGGLSIPLPANPLPVADLGDHATGGSFITPNGGVPIPGSTDQSFRIGLTPGEPVSIGRAGSGGQRVMQPVVIQVDGRQLYKSVIDIDERSSQSRLRR